MKNGSVWNKNRKQHSCAVCCETRNPHSIYMAQVQPRCGGGVGDDGGVVSPLAACLGAVPRQSRFGNR